tara:strand:- start:27583 stop:27684 length:102 start_codon:yes stop_codon:yes gene_type:complete
MFLAVFINNDAIYDLKNSLKNNFIFCVNMLVVK